MKKIITLVSGFVWGAITFFGLGYSILFLGNLIEEPGSYDYEAEGEAMRIYGLYGCIIYAFLFVMILFSLKSYKHHLIVFLSSMVLTVIALGIYIFLFR